MIDSAISPFALGTSQPATEVMVETFKGCLLYTSFTMGDAVELNRIAEAIGEDPETTLETIRKMMKDYQKKERGRCV